jgi:hypothetical protein
MELLQSKGKHFMKLADDFKLHLVPEEAVLASIQVGMSNFLLTNFRFVALGLSGGIKSSTPLSEIEEYRFEKTKMGSDFYLKAKGNQEKKIGVVLNDVAEPFEELFTQLHRSGSSDTGLRTESLEAAEKRYAQIPTNLSKEKLPKNLVKAIMRNSRANEDPVMVISGKSDSAGGSIIVYADRCVVAKYGMTQGLPGTVTEGVFKFDEITGIEYNKGLVISYLEILTASYKGSINSNIVNAVLTTKSNSNNSIQLMPGDYDSAKPLLDRLQTMIQQAKNSGGSSLQNQPEPNKSAADEIAKLAELLDKGLLTPEEFRIAKARALE